MPQEVVQYSRAEPVWTGGLKELRHLKENSGGGSRGVPSTTGRAATQWPTVETGMRRVTAVLSTLGLTV